MTVAGKISYTSNEGIFTIDKWQVEGIIESNASVNIWTNGVNPTKSLSANHASEHTDLIKIYVELRPCLLGEVTVVNTCKVCDEFTYSLDPNENSCKECP